MSDQRRYELPLIPLRGMVVLPGEVVHCDIGRKKTLAAVEAAVREDGLAAFTMQKNPCAADVTSDELQPFGTVCRIRQVFRLQNDTVHLLVTGVARAEIADILSETPCFQARLSYPEEPEVESALAEAFRRRLTVGFLEHAEKKDRLTQDQRDSVVQLAGFSELVDAVAQHVVSRPEDKQRILETVDPARRAVLLLALLENELEVMKLDQAIAAQVRAAAERNQKEFYLREQIRAAKHELGEDEDGIAEGYRKRLAEKAMPDTARARLQKEIDRFDDLPRGSHEQPMAQAYIELMLDLPWTEKTDVDFDMEQAKAVLDRDHYGMEKVKQRIVETLAVQKLSGNPQGQILCLVGPPGVGKTSIARAIAEATGRQFVRMSLGGVHDEADIRGHRRTYIGAQPGRVLNAMRQAGAINPLLLFDEIDKLSRDVHGDPASAMLEVLDSAQNHAFVDHFLEIPYDLSRCMMLTTANDADGIPGPLRDRMELIEVPSYLFDEKLEIAKRHLLPREMKENGLKKSNLRIEDRQIAALIEGYTREAGVRELARVLGAVCRKTACEIVAGKPRVLVTKARITEWFGPRKYRRDDAELKPAVGVAHGLAWTPVGGVTLDVEVSVVSGSGALKLTGQLGDVMQESCQAALTCLKDHAEALGLAQKDFSKLDIHIHVPEGAVQKDGPSAGVAMATALLSALTGTPVAGTVAMTGEITLRGRVLPIGGLREKLLAAVRAGIVTVILPEQNRESLYDVPEPILDALELVFANDIRDVFRAALCGPVGAQAGETPLFCAKEDAHAALPH